MNDVSEAECQFKASRMLQMRNKATESDSVDLPGGSGKPERLMLNFAKMNGAGNDFVVVDNRELLLLLKGDQIARLCDRHRGIGADGLLAVEPAEKGADFRMRYYNCDGGEVEMCGNGARCFARFAREFTGSDEITFETMAGPIKATFPDGLVRIDMGEPQDLALREELSVAGTTMEVHSVNTGVPHAVVFVNSIDSVNIDTAGAAIRYHEHFAPRGTNVNFLEMKDMNHIAIRTYERGVEGETLACGTGIVACAIIYHELEAAGAPVTVRVKGGDDLLVDFEELAGIYRSVTLTGPADLVFEGRIAL
jgi:diaminopimelate epimerase